MNTCIYSVKRVKNLRILALETCLIRIKYERERERERESNSNQVSGANYIYWGTLETHHFIFTVSSTWLNLRMFSL